MIRKREKRIKALKWLMVALLINSALLVFEYSFGLENLIATIKTNVTFSQVILGTSTPGTSTPTPEPTITAGPNVTVGGGGGGSYSPPQPPPPTKKTAPDISTAEKTEAKPGKKPRKEAPKPPSVPEIQPELAKPEQISPEPAEPPTPEVPKIPTGETAAGLTPPPNLTPEQLREWLAKNIGAKNANQEDIFAKKSGDELSEEELLAKAREEKARQEAERAQQRQAAAEQQKSAPFFPIEGTTATFSFLLIMQALITIAILVVMILILI